VNDIESGPIELIERLGLSAKSGNRGACVADRSTSSLGTSNIK